MRLARSLLFSAAVASSPLYAGGDVVEVAETIDRQLFVYADSVLPIPDENRKPDFIGAITFLWMEVYRNKAENGAGARHVSSAATCLDAMSRQYATISDEFFAIKDGKAVSLSGQHKKADWAFEEVRPVSVERLVVDKACWIAFGRNKGGSEPVFGVQPQDAKRIACTVAGGRNEMTFHVAFHEPTSRVFWQGRLATDASLTAETITFRFRAGEEVMTFYADRITGRARFGPASSSYPSTGECSKVVSQKF